MFQNNDLSEVNAHFFKKILSCEPIRSGFLHEQWKIKTSNGIFVLKKINKNITNETRYLFSEKCRQAFSQTGIATSPQAFGKTDWPGEENYFAVVRPFVSGASIQPFCAHAFHLEKVGACLAQLHQTKTNIPQQTPACVWLETDPKNLASIFPFEKNEFEKILFAREQLKKTEQLCHRDFYPGNILWTREKKIIVMDWEGVGLLSPEIELLNVALNWSDGFTNFQPALFIHLLKAYQEAGGAQVLSEQTILASQYGWLVWLYFLQTQQQQNLNSEKKFLFQKAEAETLQILKEFSERQKEWMKAINSL